MFETILWATDGSESATKALPYAAWLARTEDARLVALHVRELMLGRGGGYPVLADDDDLRAVIRRQVDALADEGVAATLEVVSATGTPARAIADTARKLHADVIVVGTRGYGAVGGLIVGSVTQGLLRAASCPVLAVPARTPALAADADRTLAGVPA